jgi:hypothetical protein
MVWEIKLGNNKYNIDGASRLENPPLWVWAIIAGAIIASKFIYRWQSTKYFAKEAEEKRSSDSRRINRNDDKTKDIQNNIFYGDIVLDATTRITLQ